MCSAAKERKKTEDDPVVETERKTDVYTLFQITNNPAPHHECTEFAAAAIVQIIERKCLPCTVRKVALFFITSSQKILIQDYYILKTKVI